MNKIAKKILIFGISLIALSFLLLIHFEWEEKYSKRESNNIMNKLIDEESKNEENNLIVINDLEYIGYIVIPSLDLNLPVSKNFSYSSLKKTPALYYGSIKNNNLVICVRNKILAMCTGNLNILLAKDKVDVNEVKQFNLNIRNKSEEIYKHYKFKSQCIPIIYSNYLLTNLVSKIYKKKILKVKCK